MVGELEAYIMKNNYPPSNVLDLTFKPVTKELWTDLQALFGERGACGGCWCMLWRLTRKEFEARKGEGNRLALKAIVDSGEVPVLLTLETPECYEGLHVMDLRATSSSNRGGEP